MATIGGHHFMAIIFLLVPPAIEQAVPNDGHCCLWSEVEGKWCSNEIGSCMLQYLQSLPITVREISMFSDMCDGQNRNQNIAVHHINVIEEKFLEKDIGLPTWNVTPCIQPYNLLKRTVVHFVCRLAKPYLKWQGAKIHTKCTSWITPILLTAKCCVTT